SAPFRVFARIRPCRKISGKFRRAFNPDLIRHPLRSRHRRKIQGNLPRPEPRRSAGVDGQTPRTKYNTNMKPTRYPMMLALILGATATAQAQRPARGGDGPPPPPILVALDTDRNGVLNAAEIEKAAESLLALDGDGDGKIDREEL